MRKIIVILLLFNMFCISAQTDARAPKGFTLAQEYRQNPNLSLYIYYPENMKKGKSLPAIVLFFGGGWITGTPKSFEN